MVLRCGFSCCYGTVAKRYLGVTPSSNQRDPESDHQILPMRGDFFRVKTECAPRILLHVKTLNKMIKKNPA